MLDCFKESPIRSLMDKNSRCQNQQLLDGFLLFNRLQKILWGGACLHLCTSLFCGLSCATLNYSDLSTLVMNGEQKHWLYTTGRDRGQDYYALFVPLHPSWIEDIKQHCQEPLLHLRFHQWFKSKPVWTKTTSQMSSNSEKFNFSEIKRMCFWRQAANLIFPHFLLSGNEAYVRD